MPEKVGPVMLPAMLRRFETGDYVALGSRTRPQAWQGWLDLHRDAPKPRTIQLFDHHFLMVEAALDGLGVALALKAIASDDARLEAPLDFDPDGTDYALLHPAGLAVSPDIAALIDWIRAIAKD